MSVNFDNAEMRLLATVIERFTLNEVNINEINYTTAYCRPAHAFV
jgi:hypothetical protein